MSLVFFGLLAITHAVPAQGPTRIHTTNTNAWFMYFGNHKFSNRFGIPAEVQLRRNNFVSDAQQTLLRAGLNYDLTDKGKFTLGYGFIETFPYGEFAVPNTFPEHRIWQQYQTSQAIGQLNLSHRYRLEQRMIGNAVTGEFKDGRFENRIRYMAKATVNITKGEKPVFLSVYDEIFVNFGKQVGYNIFDQNRLYGALGLTFSDEVKIEIGYLYQVVQLRSLNLVTPRNQIENNHTFQLALFSNFTLAKRN